jgi:hypothetical protein
VCYPSHNNSPCCILVHHFIYGKSITLILTYKWSLHWTDCFLQLHLFNSLVLLPLVVMLGWTKQKSQFLCVVTYCWLPWKLNQQAVAQQRTSAEYHSCGKFPHHPPSFAEMVT